jgi:hypothetical protein
MPRVRRVILFTLHAYGSWMPDRPQGFYRNSEGLHPRNPLKAGQFRRSQVAPEAMFDEAAQLLAIEVVREAATRLGARMYGVATDPVHLHFMTAWDDERTPEQVQRSFKWSLTRRLNSEIGRRPWFTRKGHDRRVRDKEHFVYLLDKYLPSHRGWKWDARRGVYR